MVICFGRLRAGYKSSALLKVYIARHLAPQVAQNMAPCTRSALSFSGGALALMAREPHLGHCSPPDSTYDL